MKYILLAAGLFAVCLWQTAAHGEMAASMVAVGEVKYLHSAPRSWTPGTVLSRTDSALGAEVAGVITWIADPGTRVAQGDVVARLDNSLAGLAVQSSEAQVSALEKRLIFLRSDAQRLASLAEVNSAAESRLEESVANRDVAVADLQRARAELEINRYKLEKAEISAPFAGQIVERLAEAGEYVNVGQPTVRLVDTHHVEVRSRAPLRVAPFVRDGMVLPVRLNEETRQLPVHMVIPVGDLSSRTFEVRLRLQDNPWVIGTPVQVGLPTATSRRILTIPRDALVLRESGTVVFKVAEGNAQRVEVQTGIGADERIEVQNSGLNEGDQVVVKGAEMLRNGQPVTLLTR